MRRLTLGLFVAMLVCVRAFTAFAESSGDFEKDLKAFRQKVTAEAKAGMFDSVEFKEKAAKEASPFAAKKSPKKVKRETGSSPLGTESEMPPIPESSPLGLASGLPVGEELPATSYAMQSMTPEEMQARADAEMEAQKKKIDDQTFEDAVKVLLPLQPGQIRKVLGTFKDSREAAETPIAMPVPKIQVETISLDPSVPPPVIKTAQGRVSTLTVLDSSGAPWPIQDVTWAGKFDVSPPEEGGHVVRITPDTTHGAGNISMRLVDLITPITFTLQAGLEEVYYRFDARIPKQGPLAKTPLIEYGGLKTVTGGDENLVQVLDGTPPGKSEKLKVDGVDGRTSAWRVSGKMYLRTPLTLLSPTWDSSVTSADGMNVYTLSDTPVILLSDEGRMVRAHIAADEVTP